ncbi:MAG: hypothetical protein ABJN05_06310, partial [Sulfitobacter dubius]
RTFKYKSTVYIPKPSRNPKGQKWTTFTPPATTLCRRYRGRVLLRRSHVYGANFVFAGWRYVSPELEARAKREALEQRKAKQRRADELARAVRAKETAYVAAVAEACEREYKKDRFRALTTPICGEIFKVRGLP